MAFCASEWVYSHANYDGDGKTDLSVRNSQGEWRIDYAANGFGAWDVVLVAYGSNNIPLAADFDGDGKYDLSARNNQGEWRIDYAANGFGAWDIVLSGY